MNNNKNLCVLFLFLLGVLGCTDFHTTQEYIPTNKEQFSLTVYGASFRVPLPNTSKISILSSNFCWITLGDENIIYKKGDNYRIPPNTRIILYRFDYTHGVISVGFGESSKIMIQGVD